MFDENASKDIQNKIRTFTYSISPNPAPRSVLRIRDNKFYIAKEEDIPDPTSLFFKYMDKVGGNNQRIGEYLGDITKKALTNALASIVAYKRMII